MKHTYQIAGMTCNGCRSDVEKRLNAIPSVKEAMVTLENEQAVILMATHTGIKTLQEALPKKYVITAMTATEVADSSSGHSPTIKMETSKWVQLLPLFLIIGYLSVATVLLNYQREHWDEAMLDFMGLFFIVFSFFKMLDLKGFSISFARYDPLAKITSVYAWGYPFLETALGLMFLMRFEIDIALIATLILLGITTIGVTKTLLDKKSISCACLGTALKLPMTEATFIENAIMILMAIFMLF
ncbi:MauE/DoxX family redox-associated membrane protein [Nonlabens sp.]|uniref:heavy metal translocating P-type ATPase n=1 Tax=Nonlabens sp. TaxID=1888209 RepID=UPI001BCA7F73|nr:MauE/DoxX family redox-associated membrane protein [Nonlabens sp.]